MANIDYSARDYDSILVALTNFIKSDPNYIKYWTDFFESDIGQMLLKVISYAGAINSYVTDQIAREIYLSTCEKYASALKHSKTLGYPVQQASAASVKVLSTGLKAISDGLGTLNIEKSTSFTLETKTFELLTKVIFPSGVNEVITNFYEGKAYSESFTSDGSAFQNFTTKEGSVIDGSWTVKKSYAYKNTLGAGDEVQTNFSGVLSPIIPAFYRETLKVTAKRKDYKFSIVGDGVNPFDPVTNNYTVGQTILESSGGLWEAKITAITNYEMTVNMVSGSVSAGNNFESSGLTPITGLVRSTPVQTSTVMTYITDPTEDPENPPSSWNLVDKLDVDNGVTPPYSVKGTVDASGNIDVTFDYPVKEGEPVDVLYYTSIDEAVLSGENTEVYLGTVDPANKWSRVSSLLESGAENVYSITYVNDSQLKVTFGDGVNGNVPSNGQAIIVNYRKGGGTEGNIAAGSLETSNRRISSYVNNNENRILINNPESGSGGVNRESIDHIKAFAPEYYKSTNRAITPDDTNALASTFSDPTHGEVGAAKTVKRETGLVASTFMNDLKTIITNQQGNNEFFLGGNPVGSGFAAAWQQMSEAFPFALYFANIIDVYIWGLDSEGVYTLPSEGLKTALYNRLNSNSTGMETVVYYTKSGSIVNLDIIFNRIYIEDGFSKSDISVSIIDALKTLIKSYKVPGTAFKVADIYRAVTVIDGILDIDLYSVHIVGGTQPNLNNITLQSLELPVLNSVNGDLTGTSLVSAIKYSDEL